MTIQLPEIAALLAREYAFQGIPREKLMEIAAQFMIERINEGSFLATLDRPMTKFYLVFSGRLRIETILGKREQENFLIIGDYLGDEQLLTSNAPNMVVEATEDTILLSLETQQFKHLLAEYPSIETAIHFTLTSRRMARSLGFSWLQPEETIFFICRKHFIFLLRALIFPIFLLVLSLPFISIGIAENGSGAGGVGALIIGVLILLLSLFFFIWSWLDWRNDYYIVTGQRVVWIEKILLFYDSRDDVLLNNILAVDVFTTFFGRFFGYGDVSARTFTGRVPLQKTAHPTVMASYIDGLRLRAEEYFRKLESEQVQEYIAQALRKRQAPSLEDIIPVIQTKKSTKSTRKKEQAKKQHPGWRERWQHFLKFRFEQNGIITYRKSLPILLFRIALPLFLLFLWFVALVFLIIQVTDTGVIALISIIMFVVLCGLIFWLGYLYVDWRNDIYQITPTQIFDI
jgi:CRP-like cAMP-binding protein